MTTQPITPLKLEDSDAFLAEEFRLIANSEHKHVQKLIIGAHCCAQAGAHSLKLIILLKSGSVIIHKRI